MISDPSRVADHLTDIPPRRTCQTLRGSFRHQAGGYHGDVPGKYSSAAMRRATFEVIEDDGSFYGRIPALEGVWANSATLEDCRAELEQILEEWLSLRLSERLPIPEIDGIDLTLQQQVA